MNTKNNLHFLKQNLWDVLVFCPLQIKNKLYTLKRNLNAKDLASYKIRKYSNFKRRYIFDTYEPEKRVDVGKEKAVPIFMRVMNKVVVLGGLFGFFISTIVIGVKEVFSFKKKINKRGKLVEFRIKNGRSK